MTNDTLHTAATAAAGAIGAGLILFGVVLSALHLGDPSQAFTYGPLFLAGSGLIAWQKMPAAGSAEHDPHDGVQVAQPHG